MSIPTDTLSYFRGEWATRLTDSCVIRESSGETLNTTTGELTPTWDTHYSGPCLVRPKTAISDMSVEAGGLQVELRGYLVVIPYDETDVGVDMEVLVTSFTDSQLNGKTLIVRNVRTDTYNTARKLDCEDNQGG